MALAEDVRAGDRLALARLLSWLEEGDPQGEAVLAELYPHAGGAHRIGVTGPPGCGKSTLVNQAARWCRDHGAAHVAVIAVDPSSPFSGGAILGDRIRMRDLAGDAGVFIRSMASRGALGGLAWRTAALADALVAGGYELVFIETVGAGQAEVDVARMADTTIVVEAPGMGDEVQAIKAGILEIADVLVVNKADLPGAQATVQALQSSIGLARRPSGAWSPPILTTIAETGEGVEAMMEAVRQHQAHLHESGEGKARERARAADRLEAELRRGLTERFRQDLPDGRFEAEVKAVLERRKTPAQAAAELMGEI